MTPDEPRAAKDPAFFAPIVGCVVLMILGLWITPPATLQHITAIVGVFAPLLPLVAVVVAIYGWRQQARRNGEEARRTEKAKQDHVRQGTRRQVRTLLRDALATIKPFSYLESRLELDDVIRTYNRFMDRLNQRETWIDLLDHEYDAIDEFAVSFGKAIALAEQHQARNPAPPSLRPSSPPAVLSYDKPFIPEVLDERAREEREKERRCVFDEHRGFFAKCFSDTLPQLDAALALFGDDDEMRRELKETAARAQQTAYYMMKRQYPDLPY